MTPRWYNRLLTHSSNLETSKSAHALPVHLSVRHSHDQLIHSTYWGACKNSLIKGDYSVKVQVLCYSTLNHAIGTKLQAYSYNIKRKSSFFHPIIRKNNRNQECRNPSHTQAYDRRRQQLIISKSFTQPLTK